MVFAYGCIDVIVKRSSMRDYGERLIRENRITRDFYDDDLICVPGGMSPGDAESAVKYLESEYNITIIDFSDV